MAFEAPAGGCAIRMYRQGLGDCFLLAFGAKNGQQKYMLIDCGVLLGTPDAETKMQAVVDDICQATGNHLHVLAITHEHWDHVSGFMQAKDKFEKLKVDEVWFAWTEDPDNSLAQELRNRRGLALKALGAALERMDSSQQYTSRIKGVTSFFGEVGADGSVKTEQALDWVKKKWTKHRYIEPGGKPLSIPGLTGTRLFALGPPADKKLINKCDSTSEVYLDDAADGMLGLYLKALEAKGVSSNEQPDDRLTPFNPAYGRSPNHSSVEDVQKRYGSEPWRNIDTDWLGAAGELALQLDSHTNNTSLVLAIEIVSNGKVLLFPGDAQVGNWLSWDSVCWSGDCADIAAKDLLSRTVLYKVGHHGSHNATLRDKGLERMVASDLAALIPVSREMAAKKKWEMPHKPLLKRLKELASGRVVLADGGLPDADGDASINKFLKLCSEDQLYIDVTVQGGK